MEPFSSTDPHLPLNRKYRPELDGLRAFGVVAAIINHFDESIIPSGFVGLDMFFVISGYVITSSMCERNDADFRSFLAGFYERRFKRLLPALILVVVSISLLFCMVHPDPAMSIKTGMYALFGTSNMYLLSESNNFLAQSSRLNPFIHTWSLGVEEQFYFLYPFLFWYSGFGNKKEHGRRNLMILVSILALVSVVSFAWLNRIHFASSYMLMPARFWQIAIGVLVYLDLRRPDSFCSRLVSVPPTPIMVVITAMLFLPYFLFVPTTVVAVVLSAILLCCLRPETAIFKLLTHDKVVHLGVVSYCLYLWHWGIMTLTRLTFGMNWISVPIQIALMLPMALATFKWIENPLRKGKWFDKRWKTLSAGGVACLLAATLVFTFGKSLSLYAMLIPKQFAEHVGIQSQEQNNHSCHLFKDGTTALNLNAACGIQNDPAKPTIFNIGDEHAERFAPAINLIANRDAINSRNVWGFSCLLPATVRTDYWHPVMQDKNCFEVMNELQKNLLDQIKSGDSVLLSSGSLVSELVFAHKLDGFQYDLKNRNGDVLESAAAIKLHFENLGNFASTLAQAGARLYLYLPGPHFGGGPVEFDVACTSNLYWLKKATGVASDRNECRISKSKVATEQRAPLDEHLILLKSKFPEIEILDALEGDACAGETCNAAWYSDAHRMHYWSAADFLLKHFETRRNESK